MKDRLIEIIKQCTCLYAPPCDRDCGLCGRIEIYDKEIEYIVDHLLANGVIVPPCKVGDVVWWTDGCTRFAYKVEVTRISYTAEYGFDMSGFTRNQTHKMFNERDIGKTVFLTKEEAEAVLKGSVK